MIVQCPKCRRNYEDTSHSPKCDGWDGHRKVRSSAATDAANFAADARRMWAARRKPRRVGRNTKR